ncbi:hypothetical protein ACAX43_26490 [Paraburkholderia sp. IW21]|uniref:hypothetical protein n=1 Tax=Paraburkholderia sp. IW21 TaxID=3242488 RepID=UPI00352019E7
MALDREQDEFVHIRKMVLELERQVLNGHEGDLKIPVMQPEYWRSRIRTLQAMPLIPELMMTQASGLLLKLDGIADALKNGR